VKTNKEKQLEIELLIEKLQRITHKKVILKEETTTINIGLSNSPIEINSDDGGEAVEDFQSLQTPDDIHHGTFHYSIERDGFHYWFPKIDSKKRKKSIYLGLVRRGSNK